MPKAIVGAIATHPENQITRFPVAPPRPDEVKHPEHYTSHPAGVECMDVIRHYPVEIAFAIKYLWRWDKKGDKRTNIKKAIQCLEMFLTYDENFGGKNA